MKVTKQYRTETGHRLINYDGKCSHLHGHSYLWEVTVESGSLNNQEMVMDFKHLKGAMKTVLEPLDHAMVLSNEDPLVEAHGIKGLNEMFVATNGAKPRLKIWGGNPTAESFSQWAAHRIQKILWEEYPDFTVVNVRVWETVNSYAEWGLNK